MVRQAKAGKVSDVFPRATHLVRKRGIVRPQTNAIETRAKDDRKCSPPTSRADNRQVPQRFRLPSESRFSLPARIRCMLVRWRKTMNTPAIAAAHTTIEGGCSIRYTASGKKPAARTDPSEMYRVTATVITKDDQHGRQRQEGSDTGKRRQSSRPLCHLGISGTPDTHDRPSRQARPGTSTVLRSIQRTDPPATRQGALRDIKQKGGESQTAARRAQDIRRANIPAAHSAYIFAALQLHQTDSQMECRRSGMRPGEPEKQSFGNQRKFRELRIDGTAWTRFAGVQK